MSTAELKNILIQKIISTNDEQLLREATRLMEIQLNESEIEYELTADMNKAIDEAQQQVKRGEYLSHDQANQEIEEWLGE